MKTTHMLSFQFLNSDTATRKLKYRFFLKHQDNAESDFETLETTAEESPPNLPGHGNRPQHRPAFVDRFLKFRFGVRISHPAATGLNIRLPVLHQRRSYRDATLEVPENGSDLTFDTSKKREGTLARVVMCTGKDGQEAGRLITKHKLDAIRKPYIIGYHRC